MVRAAALAPRLTIMAYLSQPWFNREIVNRFAMATGVVHSETLTLIEREQAAAEDPRHPCRATSYPEPLACSTNAFNVAIRRMSVNGLGSSIEQLFCANQIGQAASTADRDVEAVAGEQEVRAAGHVGTATTSPC